MTVRTITRNFINLIYPLHCAGCSHPLEALNELAVCGSCRAKILRNPKPYCRSYGRSFDRVYSACLYDGILKDLIHLFKFKFKLALARLLSDLMIDFIKSNDEILADIDMITFVPLDGRRLRERGFNQSKILAHSISEEFGIPLSDALRKVRPTRHQNELSRQERFTNLANAFSAKAYRDSLTGLRILVIDDVMTTGATLDECSKALLGAGVCEVRCLTLARGI